MIENVKKFVAPYVALDDPIPYKDLLICPVSVRNSSDFMFYADVLCTEKNSISDFEVIQMNYLDFVVDYLMQDKTVINEKLQYTMGDLYKEKLLLVLAMCIKDVQNIMVYKKDNHNILCIIVNVTDDKGNMVPCDVHINAQEFDDIRRIIMYQNIYDYSDDYVNPEIKEAMEEYYKIVNKGMIDPELEDKIAALTAMTGLMKRDILTMTWREFQNVFSVSLSKLDYQISKTAELSGMVKFDKPIKHWVYQRQQDKYKDAFTSYDKFKKKII